MARLRLIPLGVLAVFATGAVASASASAHEFFGPGHVELAGGTAVEGRGGNTTMGIVWDGVHFEVRCERDTLNGTLESGGKMGSSEITLNECKLITGEKKCELSSAEEAEIRMTVNGAQLEEMGGRLVDRFEPMGSTNTVLTLAIEKKGSDTCTIEGMYKITGSQYCEVDRSNSEADVLREEHELICDAGGSELYIGSPVIAVTLTTTSKIELTGGGSWAAE